MVFELLPLIFTLLRWTDDIEPFKRSRNRCPSRFNAFPMVVHVMHFQRQVKGRWSQTEQACSSRDCIRPSRMATEKGASGQLSG